MTRHRDEEEGENRVVVHPWYCVFRIVGQMQKVMKVNTISRFVKIIIISEAAHLAHIYRSVLKVA